MSFGEQVKNARLMKLMNQAQLAVAVGYSVATIQKVEGDKPGPATLAKATIAQYLGIDFDVQESLAAERRQKEYPAELQRLRQDLHDMASTLAKMWENKQAIPSDFKRQFGTLQKLLASERMNEAGNPFVPSLPARKAARKKRDGPR